MGLEEVGDTFLHESARRTEGKAQESSYIHATGLMRLKSNSVRKEGRKEEGTGKEDGTCESLVQMYSGASPARTGTGQRWPRSRLQPTRARALVLIPQPRDAIVLHQRKSSEHSQRLGCDCMACDSPLWY